MTYKGQIDWNLNPNIEIRQITCKEMVEVDVPTPGLDSMLCGLAPNFSHPIKLEFLKFKGSEYPMTWNCRAEKLF